MYSSCLFCHTDLGANEAVEHFPVGRRLAFDSANGRFWVICPSCKRWNLSPLEERWDAIGDCERLYERTRLRMSTDNIGLAHIAEGTELVRVGPALRPEMAAWRFGAQLAARRRQYRWFVVGGLIVTGGFSAGAAAAGAGLGAFSGIWQLMQRGYERATRLLLPVPVRSAEDPDSPGWRWAAGIDRPQTQDEIARAMQNPRVETRHVRGARLWLDPATSELEVKVPVIGRRLVEYRGTGAESVLPKLVAKFNRWGGRRSDEQLAVQMLTTVAEDGAPDLTSGLLRRYLGRSLATKKVGEYGSATSIALEMALQEQRERELLAGELLDLEFAWKEAEELARIADTLVPSSIDQALARLKARMDR
ncbi:MAG: hypothetical protein Q8K55_09190 [Gemmatimonadaceae bacterium]|nr:hypothetical protein [Gemmatimonadaceae bacterium]